MIHFPNGLVIDPDAAAAIARRALGTTPLRVERMSDGGSTFVFRIVTEGERFYLRVLPEEGASFAPEVEVHRRLRQDGVKVAEVVHYEHLNELVPRWIMVTTEIRGEPVGYSDDLSSDDLEDILIAAGKDVARINRVTVDGFGWIDRGGLDSSRLSAEWPTYRAFALEFWNTDLTYLERETISRATSKRCFTRILQL